MIEQIDPDSGPRIIYRVKRAILVFPEISPFFDVSISNASCVLDHDDLFLIETVSIASDDIPIPVKRSFAITIQCAAAIIFIIFLLQ